MAFQATPFSLGAAQSTFGGAIMNSNQRSQGNNQSDNGGNEKSVSSSRGGTVEKDNLNQSQQSGTLGAGQKQKQGGTQQGSRSGQESIDRTGSQTGNQQQGQPLSTDDPAAPRGRSLSADEDMDDDTGLSNKGNRQSGQIDEGSRQSQQSNVGRRDDGTPD
jgi:hypothetical protein